jgi:aspartate 1-decarboxylase
MNGPAALKFKIGDLVIVLSYATMDFNEAKKFKPALIYPDSKNSLPQGSK